MDGWESHFKKINSNMSFHVCPNPQIVPQTLFLWALF